MLPTFNVFNKDDIGDRREKSDTLFLPKTFIFLVIFDNLYVGGLS